MVDILNDYRGWTVPRGKSLLQLKSIAAKQDARCAIARIGRNNVGQAIAIYVTYGHSLWGNSGRKSLLLAEGFL